MLGFWRPCPSSAQSWCCRGCIWLTLPQTLLEYERGFLCGKQVGNEGDALSAGFIGCWASRSSCVQWEEPRLVDAVLGGSGLAPAQFAGGAPLTWS